MWRFRSFWMIVALLALVTDSTERSMPPVSILARQGQRWPPHAEEFQQALANKDSQQAKPHRQVPPESQADWISMAMQQMQSEQPMVDAPSSKDHSIHHTSEGKSGHQRRSTGKKSANKQHSSNVFPEDRQSFATSGSGRTEYDYDLWPSGSDRLPNDSDDDVDPLLVASMPCQIGNPHVDSKNCTDTSRISHYQFPSGTLIIEAHVNQTIRDLLKICGDIEATEIDGTDDVLTLIGSVNRHVSKFDQGPANSAVFLVNLENYSKWSKDKVIDIMRSSIDSLRSHFEDLIIYSKFHRDGAESTETVLLQLRYDIKFWLSNLCSKGLARCADLASITFGSAVELSTDIEDHLNPAYPENVDQATALTQKYCRQLGLGPGTRIIDLKPVISDDIPTQHSSGESSLMLSDLLPKNQMTYDKNRPPKYHGRPTVVYYHVTVLSIDTINEESMTYVADIFLGQSWRDHRLRLPENMTTEYRILDVSWLQNIWRPDCFFKNAKRVTFHEMSVPNHYLWLYHDKTLLYMAKLTLVLSCAMKFETYPHDTQICSLMIESLSHTTHDLVFKWNITDPLVVNPDIELPQLDIAKNNTEDCTLEYSTGNFTCLAVVFNLQRRLGYHLFHTYIPSALIVVMSWISFWIKPEAIPARVTLGVTSLLTLATQSTQSQRSLPPVSYVKGIDIWMSSCTVFVFMSLMEFAVVNHFMGPVATKLMKGYSDENITSPSMAKGGFSTNGRGGSLRARNQMPPLPVTPQYVTFCHGREVALFIDKWSRLFFPFSFIILNIVYWVTFLPPTENFS